MTTPNGRYVCLSLLRVIQARTSVAFSCSGSLTEVPSGFPTGFGIDVGDIDLKTIQKETEDIPKCIEAIKERMIELGRDSPNRRREYKALEELYQMLIS